MGGNQSKPVTQLSERSSDQETSEISSNAAENVSQSSVPDQTSEQTSLKPIEVITKQTCNESVQIFRGKDGDRLAWHVILVLYEKLAKFKQKKSGSFIQVEDFGRNIEYRNKAGVVCQASGYDTAPPEELMKWINENYDPCAVDDNTPLSYISDDIRLCTIQRGVPEQPLGIFPHYHRHERFHYVKLSNDHESTLAFHAGVKSFDRIIEYNGINIEDDSAENFKKNIDDINVQFVQLLVCSPATYAHYKKNNKHLHSNLDTVKRLKPVRDIASCKNKCRLLQQDDISQPIILTNSRHIANNNNYDTLQDIDDALFVTAYQQPITDTMENKTVSVVKNVDSPQILPKQADIYSEKKDDDKKRRERERQKLIQHLAVLLIDDQNNLENGVEIHRTPCHGCGSSRIQSDRYRCLECYNYDLCGRCFDQRRETLTHVNGHVMVHFTAPDEIFGEPVVDINRSVTLNKFKEKYVRETHIDVSCNTCKMMPIKGLRFKCDVCHDYNLCITCMEKHDHDMSHPLIAIGKSCFLEIAINDIELRDELGRGGFGTVYKAKWLSKNRPVACKVISVPPDHEHLEKSFRKELAAYAELSGPYILKTYGYNIQELSSGVRKCMLVMEFMSRGSLSSVLRQKEKIPLRRKLEMACQIASGMRKLHAHHMIHRDIRPDNILVTQDYTAKIGDMGLARVWLPDENLTLIGCVAYMPFDFYTGKYDQSLDVYTFGLTINELFTEKRHQFNLLTRRVKLTNYSPVFADLIARCMHNESSQRPSAIEIETTLRMYKQAVEKYIIEKNIKYADMSTEDKNLTFITSYYTLHPEIDELLKHKFPPTPTRTDRKLTVSTNKEYILDLLQRLGDP